MQLLPAACDVTQCRAAGVIPLVFISWALPTYPQQAMLLVGKLTSHASSTEGQKPVKKNLVETNNFFWGHLKGVWVKRRTVLKQNNFSISMSGN
jgi:hypothetical protein